jgi:S-adenosylmethionine:tRNA ribosyltransferase-isomerase
MNLSEFDYHLPEHAIAQQPLPDRAASRMLVLHRDLQSWEDRSFRDLPEYLREGDCLILNDSKVFPSRLFGKRAGTRSLPIGKNNPKRHEYLSGRVEIFLLRPVSEDQKTWEALVRPGRKMRTGEVIHIGDDFQAEILARSEFGERTLRFETRGEFFDAVQRAGHVPLPPYIKRPDTPLDRERYQTIFARQTGSVAAPTAGLHFTPETLAACRAAGSEIAYITLHVGLGTFQPIHTETIEEHKLHSELFEITDENARLIRKAKRRIAVGTTSVRTIESAARNGAIVAQRSETSIFLYPGVHFRATDAMLTNFHLPQSSLLLLVCAFAGKDFTLAAYRHALEAGYRFYSYGDCMLIL